MRYYCLAIALFLLGTLSGCKQDTARKSGKSPVEEVSAQTPVQPELADEQLRNAALEGDLAAFEEALQAGADVNAPDSEGHTALMFAGFNGHSGIVLKLLDAGAGIDRRDLMGRTALLYTATGPFPETVRILLDRGANPNVVDSDEHFSPLMHAAAEGNLEVVKLLVAAGADRNLQDVDGDDAASFARQSGHLAVSDYLEGLK